MPDALILDEIAQTGGSYTPLQLGLASALACGAFTFLLGGGPIEMLLAFLGAGVGQYVRARLTQRRLTLFGCIALPVAAACLVYAALFRLASLLWPIDAQHQAGYICAMLFIIPGFPFITSGIDMAKQDMRSGLERLAYALMIVVVATLTAWGMALTTTSGKALIVAGFQGDMPFFSQHAGYIWLYGLILVQVVLLILPARWFVIPTHSESRA